MTSRIPSPTAHLAATGPFDVIGDVHGCAAELEALLARLGFDAASGRHPGGRVAVFVGDLTDRGPDSPGVLRRVMRMRAAGSALCVKGNHDARLGRWLSGKQVALTHGLEHSAAQLTGADGAWLAAVEAFVGALPAHALLDGGRLVVAHAGLPEAMHGESSSRATAFALYGGPTGERDEHGFPIRADWPATYRGAATVVYGHTPVVAATWRHNTIDIDTGCVFGGALTALRYPERELVAVPALRAWHPHPVIGRG